MIRLSLLAACAVLCFACHTTRSGNDAPRVSPLGSPPPIAPAASDTPSDEDAPGEGTPSEDPPRRDDAETAALSDDAVDALDARAPRDQDPPPNLDGNAGTCEPRARLGVYRFADPASDVLRHGAEGRLGHVVDGDTLDILVDGTAYRLRLLGYDSPECEKESLRREGISRFRCVQHPSNDHWGHEAYCEAVALSDGRRARVTCDDAPMGGACSQDANGRWLVYVEVEGVGDLGERMISAGAAWSFTRFPSTKRGPYCDAEDAAREAGAGMWAIGAGAVFARMSESNRRWYRDRDERCAQAPR